jgi:AraC-like DNA-binding protein
VALFLDTRDVAPEARRDSVHDAYLRADVPRQVSLTSEEAVAATRIEAWLLGSTKLFCPESPGLDVIRKSGSSQQLDPMIALCIQTVGTGLSVQDGERHRLMPGDLLMIGPTSTNKFLINGATTAVEIPFDEVGVSVEMAQMASERLSASRLFSLVGRHLLALRHEADAISTSAAAGTIGLATVQLVRALIVSAVEDERSARSVLSDALAARIFAYVRQHLTDTDLTPLKIAHVHDISLRYLYKICDAADVRLMEGIMEERLEGARRDLSAPHSSFGSVSLVARKWCFKDPSHFSNRFRRAYGVSPREFFQHCQVTAGPPESL